MSARTKTTASKPQQRKPERASGAGPIAFFVALFIIALGLIQLISTFHTYALNLSELNALKKQESALVAQKQELENNIERWNDDAYVTAQARERLGYVFPGEQAIRVEHPEAVTGGAQHTPQPNDASTSNDSKLPWYSELAYAFGQSDADRRNAKTDDGGASSGDQSTGPGDHETEAPAQGDGSSAQ
ncbi:septum formation initiator [Bifidobacterium pseudolongum subsp. globosum]|uniref:Septum formation initiator n=1 Tax=Bifidobacterium pseudolongum subsp. globosum TaxID=1690 RepID=A0A4Q5A2N6_9BIFI|nr:septum formation initiator family protein [Bifidobacterium pseudolongum]RYQ10503.1 septum formation initiator [Bifidobacterium pseudolongum subsp. globosum]